MAFSPFLHLKGCGVVSCLNPPQLPIFTGSKIEDVNGGPLQVIFIDADTGSPCQNVPQFLRVELVPIFGDFPHDGREECSSAAEFARGVVKQLLQEAFEHRASLQEADAAAPMLIHASHSSTSLPLLQDAAPAAQPPLPVTPLWLQGNPDIDFPIVDELASQGHFAFQMFDE